MKLYALDVYFGFCIHQQTFFFSVLLYRKTIFEKCGRIRLLQWGLQLYTSSGATTCGTTSGFYILFSIEFTNQLTLVFRQYGRVRLQVHSFRTSNDFESADSDVFDVAQTHTNDIKHIVKLFLGRSSADN